MSKKIGKWMFWLILLAMIVGVALYTPVLLRDPAELRRNDGNGYQTFIRNGLLPVAVYDWVTPGMTDFSAENAAHYQFKCWILPLEKYQYYGDEGEGKQFWVRGEIETGIFYVATTEYCVGEAQPKFAYKYYQ